MLGFVLAAFIEAFLMNIYALLDFSVAFGHYKIFLIRQHSLIRRLRFTWSKLLYLKKVNTYKNQIAILESIFHLKLPIFHFQKCTLFVHLHIYFLQNPILNIFHGSFLYLIKRIESVLKFDCTNLYSWGIPDEYFSIKLVM